jgi:hypothetical protein
MKRLSNIMKRLRNRIKRLNNRMKRLSSSRVSTLMKRKNLLEHSQKLPPPRQHQLCQKIEEVATRG